MNKTVFITGATSGFGAAAAEVFAQNGFRLILAGRRTERLQEAQQSLTQKFDAVVHTLPFDVQDNNAVIGAVQSLPPGWQTVDILINNAGLAAGRDYFDDALGEDWEQMIDTNLKGLLYVTKAVLPLLKKSPHPHIINMGSIAGKEVYEKGNVYCATKHAVDALSKAMRIDLLRLGVKVTAIHPGAAETEFSLVRFKGDAETARSVYAGYQPLTAQDVAHIIYYTATLPPHVCINDLVVTCTQQGSSIHFKKQNA